MPKRKIKDSIMRQARKRVASTAPKDTGTKATSTTLPQPDVELANMPCSIERNTTTFPFFRLPLEVREKIHGLVLGDQLIHLKYLNDDNYLRLNSNELWNPDLREDRFSLLVCTAISRDLRMKTRPTPWASPGRIRSPTIGSTPNMSWDSDSDSDPKCGSHVCCWSYQGR